MTAPITEFALVVNDPRVTQSLAQTMAVALTTYMTQFVAPAWGWTPVATVWYPTVAAAPSGVGVALIEVVPNIAGTPNGVLGWHDEEGGRVKLYIETDPVYSNGGVTLYDSSNPQNVTVLSVIAHELCEARGDWDANLWSDDPTQNPQGETAMELCDGCEDGILTLTVARPSDGALLKVGLSNFLWPSWFDPQAAAGTRLDQLGACKAPFHRTAGGYKINRQVVASSEGQDTTSPTSYKIVREYGPAYPAWKRAKHERVGSRFQKLMASCHPCISSTVVEGSL